MPSITELAIDLGLSKYLVGRTGFCIHPADLVKSIAKVGGTKDVNLAKIKQLQCTHVIVTHPQSAQDNIVLIDQLLREFAMYSEAFSAMNTSAIELKRQINAFSDALATQPKCRARVLYLIWRDPRMAVARDTCISSMLGLIDWQT